MSRVIKESYRRIAPMSIRQSRWMAYLKRVWVALLPHDAVYDDDYYAVAVDDAATASSMVMASSVWNEFSPRTVVDVGCGTGAFLVAMRELGVETFGLEYSSAGLDVCRRRGLTVSQFNLEKDSLEKPLVFDVAVSMEVAEHLPARAAERYVELLTRLSNRVVFTAAPPGQGGTDHVNEQPPEYWHERFRACSFSPLTDVGLRWSKEWCDGGVAGWYWKNLMVFEREGVPGGSSSRDVRGPSIERAGAR